MRGGRRVAVIGIEKPTGGFVTALVEARRRLAARKRYHDVVVILGRVEGGHEIFAFALNPDKLERLHRRAVRRAVRRAARRVAQRVAARHTVGSDNNGVLGTTEFCHSGVRRRTW